MNDASSPLGASAAEAADPIAVSPTAGTDLAVSADGVVAEVIHHHTEAADSR